MHLLGTANTDNSRIWSYITADGQSPILFWCRTPKWSQWANLYSNWTVAGFLYGAPSLTRGWICSLRLLLGPTSTVILGSEYRRTHDFYFTVSKFILHQLRVPGPAQSFSDPSTAGFMIFIFLSQNWGIRSPYLYSFGMRSPSYTPRLWAPFSSPFRLSRLRWSIRSASTSLVKSCP
jgi:hypothetical protein